ncbi:MAG: hypothetical protein ACI4NP_01900 [Thermoguttaceae bacterium]
MNLRSTSFLTVVVTLFLFAGAPSARAQKEAREWDAVFERQEGWLGADGIYSVDLGKDARNNLLSTSNEGDALFIFSDTIAGTTKNGGTEYDRVVMTNHSFGMTKDYVPERGSVHFIWRKPGSEEKTPQNIVDGHYWLQDGIRYGDQLWLTAILVGDAWKPKEIHALVFPIDANNGLPDFSRPTLKKRAPLYYDAQDKTLVLGSALCDDSGDDFIYVFGYVDHPKEGSRKDLVVARAPRNDFQNYARWSFYSGGEWQGEISALLSEDAALLKNISAEFSISRIPSGEAKGKWLIVYTPGTISNKIAFRVADALLGPFSEERVFYRSSIPDETPGLHCYNAKAHPIFASEKGILVSYNVNRLGSLPHNPYEYRPRFVWLSWETIEQEATSKDN